VPLVEVDLVAGLTRTTVAGRSVNLATYDGAFPGPLLRFREGDRVRLRLTNRLGEPTNLHLHGLHVPTAVDDPEKVVDDGETLVYEFELLPGSAGTYWYHPHAHGRVAEQLFRGLAGPLIVDAGDGDLPELAGVHEEVLLLKDLSIQGSRVAPHTADDWLNGKEGEFVLVNGRERPRIIAPGGLSRLRVVNACNARAFQLQLEGHELTVLGAGIGFAEQPISVESLLLAPGERADLLVTLGEIGDVSLVALPYDRGADMSGMDAMGGMGEMGGMGKMGGMGEMGGVAGMGGMGEMSGATRASDAAHHGARGRLGNTDTIVLATLAGAESWPAPRLPDHLAALPSYDAREAQRRRRIVLSEEMGTGPVRFLLNGRSYEPGRIDFVCEFGSFEIWDVVNEADMDHPFHVHVDPFIVLSRNGRPEPVRMWRDTVNLSEGEHVEILVPFEDFSGKVVYHCHIVEHEDRGMMGLFEVTSETSSLHTPA
jgi:FtsP/CotA-like multicopper oxidase with cupredoxin domain